MPNFEYIALDSRGQETTGTLSAPNEAEAYQMLRREGLYPTKVGEAGKGGVGATAKRKATKAAKGGGKKKGGKPAKVTGKVAPKILMLFTRQLATLVDAGLPLLKGLSVLGEQERNKIMNSAIHTMADSVQTGSTFSESLGQHPKIFNKLYVNMVKAGELGGVLEVVLNRLAEYQEKAQKLKNKVVAAMVYPIIVMVIAVAILIFLLAFIVPQFQKIFDEMLRGKPLPAITQFVINASDFVGNKFPFLIIGFGVLFATWKLVQMTPGGRRWIDSVALKMPIVGGVQQKTSIARFSRTLGTLVSSGVPILQALNITRDTAGNIVVAEAIDKVHEAVREGETIVTPLEASKIFPPMVISMVQVGEETGQLPDMLMKIADVYDDEVDTAVAGLTAMLEPIMIVGLALIVGTIVLALFLPLVSIITAMNEGLN
ncbi:MAG: type II secretion system F family protein [Verrucomicrobia bacterium]|nr:type II secretion system F family protein [Verrucomicrobiota bacterium]